MAQLIAIVGMAIDLTILLQYRKRLDRVLFYAILSYFVLPAITTVIMIFTYGLSLQNIAIVISAQIMFVMDTIDISSRLDRSHMALLRARHEAEHDAMTVSYTHLPIPEGPGGQYSLYGGTPYMFSKEDVYKRQDIACKRYQRYFIHMMNMKSVHA